MDEHVLFRVVGCFSQRWLTDASSTPHHYHEASSFKGLIYFTHGSVDNFCCVDFIMYIICTLNNLTSGLEICHSSFGPMKRAVGNLLTSLVRIEVSELVSVMVT